jgi:AICAR transformylase/IMP cyclohydrolase PurH
VAINLYRSRKTILKPDETLEDALKITDIAGATMPRSG